MAYWPDWVLERCKRIVELQRQGHSLTSANLELGREHVERIIEEISTGPDIAEVLTTKTVKLTGGREVGHYEEVSAA